MPGRLSVHIDALSPQEWDAFIGRMPTGHVLQTWAWGEFKAQFGWQPVRIALERGGEIAAAAQLLLRKLPLGAVAYIPKGPVLDIADVSLSQPLIAAIHREARRRGAFWCKAEPDWLDTPQARAWLTEMGFRPSPQTVQPRRTLLIDLARDEEAILAAMKSKTRYNIRLAERKGVRIREGNADDLDTFHQMMEITGKRDGFGTHSREYYATAWHLFAPQGRARLLLAEHEGIPLGGVMALAFGDKAWNMYSASNNERRNLMPNYLLQWEAICWAKAKGCRTYDLWGIPDLDEETLEEAVKADEPPTNPLPLWGLYRFKRGFGGEAVRYVGAYDYPYRPLLYRLLLWAWRRRQG